MLCLILLFRFEFFEFNCERHYTQNSSMLTGQVYMLFCTVVCVAFDESSPPDMATQHHAMSASSLFRASLSICLAFKWGQPLWGRATLPVKASICRSCSKNRWCHLPQGTGRFRKVRKPVEQPCFSCTSNHITTLMSQRSIRMHLWHLWFRSSCRHLQHNANAFWKVCNQHGSNSHLNWQELYAGPPLFLQQRKMSHKKCHCRTPWAHHPWVAQQCASQFWIWVCCRGVPKHYGHTDSQRSNL